MRLLPLLALALVLSSCRTTPDYGRPLAPGAPALLPLGPGDPHPDLAPQWAERDEILPPLERSIAWTRSPSAPTHFPIAGITHERALASLERFRELLTTSGSAQAFAEAVEREFQFHVSAGWDGRGGGVLFTAYCTPILTGSLEPTATYRYPLYGLPDDLVKGPQGEILGWQTEMGLLDQYPARRAIEAGGLLEGRGLELVWLRDPIDAFLAHVNGSAFVRLPDGDMLRLGYAGKNGRPYTSLGRELIAEGILPPDGANLEAIREWAASATTEEVQDHLFRNESYVFFTPIEDTPRGSLNVPVEPERTLATDKTLFPRGALVVVDCELQAPGGGAEPFRRILFDQDTGGAIRTAGRADIYLGIGEEAERRAGRVRAEGQLYYLFLREGPRP